MINKNFGVVLVEGINNKVQIKDNFGTVIVNGMNNQINITGQNTGHVEERGIQNTINVPRTRPQAQSRNSSNRGTANHPQVNAGLQQPVQVNRLQRTGNFQQVRVGMMQVTSSGMQTNQSIRINYDGINAPNIQVNTHQRGPHHHSQTISIQTHQGLENFSESEDEEWSSEDGDDDFDSYPEEEPEEESQQPDSEEEYQGCQLVSVPRNTKSIPDNCVICMETFNRNQPNASFLECHHWFHKDCIVRWLDDKPSCPQCKHATDVLYVNDAS